MQSGAILTFDPAIFRTQVPAYSALTPYTDAYLQMYWDMATNYISDINFGTLNSGSRVYAINLLAAHLIYLNNIIAAGGSTLLTQSSTIDKISVTLQMPPGKTQFQWWLNLSPYGQQLLALLNVLSTGGRYIGGQPELIAFRKFAGRF